MPCHHLDGKLPPTCLVALMLSDLFLAPTFSVSSIGVYANMTTLESRSPDSYTFNITIPSDGIHYGSGNPYVVHRRSRRLFVYCEPLNRLKSYPHVDTDIFFTSQSFDLGELNVSIVRRADYAAEAIGMGAECRFG